MSSDQKIQGSIRHALVEQGNLDKALESLDQCIAEDPSNGLLYRERAHLHVYLGNTLQARSDFDTTASLAANVFRTRPGRLHADSEHNAIGMTYWMEGHRALALAFWRYTTSLLLANRVGYSHMGGGIQTGLLLWFGAVHERNAEDVERVRALYEKRLASKFWSHDLTKWPGPIVRFFLNQIDETELIDGTSGNRQRLCEAHFALAIRARELRRYVAYRGHLKLVAPGKNATELYDFYNILPYFLGRFEIENFGGI